MISNEIMPQFIAYALKAESIQKYLAFDWNFGTLELTLRHYS